MKAKDLIKELLKMDPEAEVVIGGESIHFAEELPGYYDGSYEVLIENPLKKPYYAVEGLKFTRSRNKIVLHTLSLSDIIWNCENVEEVEALQFDTKELDKEYQSLIQKRIDKEKQEYYNYLKEKSMK